MEHRWKTALAEKTSVISTWDSGEPDRFLGTAKAYFSLFLVFRAHILPVGRGGLN